jgi:hypothetical protein
MKHDRRLSTCLLCECSSVTRTFFICVQYITFTPTFKSVVRERHRFGTSFWGISPGHALPTSYKLARIAPACRGVGDLPRTPFCRRHPSGLKWKYLEIGGLSVIY